MNALLAGWDGGYSVCGFVLHSLGGMCRSASRFVVLGGSPYLGFLCGLVVDIHTNCMIVFRCF